MLKVLRKWLAVSIIIAYALVSKNLTVGAAANINDLNSASEYARSSIKRLVTKEVIVGDENGNFNPGNTITRAEMITMVVKAFEIDTSNITATPTFKDVPKENWEYKYVEAAYRAGLINGVGNGNFDPQQKCTREQLAVIFIKSIGIKESDINGKQPQYIIRQLNDKAKISPWASDFIEFAMDSGLMKGVGGWNFGPDQQALREQAAVLIDRIIENKEDVLNFNKSYSGKIQYPELFNALRNNEFNYIGRVDSELMINITDNITSETIRNTTKFQGYKKLHDFQFHFETKNEATSETPIDLEYYWWQIGDKTYINYDVMNNYAEWAVYTNEELDRGEDYEVAEVGADSFYNLFAEYQITKTDNVILENSEYVDWDDLVATKYSVTFTDETIKPFAAEMLNDPALNSTDVQFGNLFNKGYNITLNYYLDDMKVLIRTEYEFSGRSTTGEPENDVTVNFNGFTKLSEIGRNFNITPP